MDTAVGNFTKSLYSLKEHIIQNYRLCDLKLCENFEQLQTDWSTLEFVTENLVQEVETLRKQLLLDSKPPIRNEEKLKLITTNSISTESYQRNYENLFQRRTQGSIIQNKSEQHEALSLKPCCVDLMSPPDTPPITTTPGNPPPITTTPGNPPLNPTSPGNTPQAPTTPGNTPPTPTTPADTRKYPIATTRQVRSLSTCSSSPTLTLTSSPTLFSTDPDFVTTTIRQRGHENKFEFFQEVYSQPYLVNVTCFVLNFLEVDTQLLFDSMERCPNLKYVEFIRILFSGPFNRTVTLPNLKEFSLFKISSSTRHCETKHLSQEEFEKLLFFVHWNHERPVPSTVTRIELVIDGWTQLKIDYESGEFVSRLSYANNILKRLHIPSFKLRKLALQACKFDASTYEYFEDLTYLNFQSILTSSSDLIKMLRHCQKNLQELRFKNYIDGGGIFLKDIPSEKLKYLCLGLCTYTLPVKYSPGIKFEKLDTLMFPTNIMDDTIIENLPSIFKSKKVVTYLCTAGIRCKNGYSILHKILQIESIEWICMCNFRRSIIGEDLNSTYQLELYEKYEEFLLSVGLNNLTSTSFILEKKEVNSPGVKFCISGTWPPSTNPDQEKNYKWIGRELSKEEHQVLEFQNRDGHKFSTWEAYMKRY